MRPSRLLLAVVLLLGVPTIATGQRARLVIPLEQLEAQAAADSNDARAHYALALACLLKRHNDDAERALREAIAIEPEFAPAHFALAFLPYARRSKLWKEQSRGRVPAEWVPAIEESYRSSRLAFLLDPFVDLKVLLAVVPARKDLGLTKRELSIYIELVKGFEFFWDGRYGQAFAWFDDIYQAATKPKKHDSVPDWLLWYHGLAAAHVLNYSVASADFELLVSRAMARDTANPLMRLPFAEANDFRYLLAVIKQRAGKRAEAVKLLEEVLVNDLSNYMAHVRLAEIHETRKQWGMALKERKRALEVDPENPSLHFDLGMTYAKTGRWPNAVTAFRDALKENQRNARIPYMLGRMHEEMDEIDKATAAYERFLELAPSFYRKQIREVQAKLVEWSGGSDDE